MNKIHQLLDEEFVMKMFRDEILPLYPSFTDIQRIEIKPYKRLIWTSTYHVVIGYFVYFIDKQEKITKLLIVCSAHSDEPRNNVFQAMKYLWEHKFNEGDIDIPHPLLYSEEFRGTFYRGIDGEPLFKYIKEQNYDEVRKLLPLSAELFARLHRLPAEERANFNPTNSRIKSVIPGVENILKEMSIRYEKKYDQDLKKMYDFFVSKEELYFLNQPKLSLIHGDAHTENIIKTGETRIGLIDFTDICLGDFARDLGTFLQQLEYKLVSKGSDAQTTEDLKNLFLNSYLKETGLKITPELQDRINLYYNWTAIRTSAFLFLKHDCDPVKAEMLFNQVKKNLNV